MVKKSRRKTKKVGKASKLLSLLGDRRVQFAIAFAIVGTIFLLTTNAAKKPLTNPAKKSYPVRIYAYDKCTIPGGARCFPGLNNGGVQLKPGKKMTLEYVLKNVEPGRYNLNFTYTIPNHGPKIFGYLKYSVSGSVVKVDGTKGGLHKVYTTAFGPSTLFSTFGKVGVKWPQNKSKFRLKMTWLHTEAPIIINEIKLQPQKSKSGWVCSSNGKCKAPPDYQYYYPPKKR